MLGSVKFSRQQRVGPEHAVAEWGQQYSSAQCAWAPQPWGSTHSVLLSFAVTDSLTSLFGDIYAFCRKSVSGLKEAVSVKTGQILGAPQGTQYWGLCFMSVSEF